MFMLSEKLKKFLLDNGYYLQLYYDGSGYIMKCVTDAKILTFQNQTRLEEFVDPKTSMVCLDIKIDAKICADTLAKEISKLAGVHAVRVV